MYNPPTPQGRLTAQECEDLRIRIRRYFSDEFERYVGAFSQTKADPFSIQRYLDGLVGYFEHLLKNYLGVERHALVFIKDEASGVLFPYDAPNYRTALNRFVSDFDKIYAHWIPKETPATLEPPASPSPAESPSQEPKGYLTQKEAAQKLGISPNTLYHKMAAGEIRYSKPGGKVAYFKQDDLVEYIERQGAKRTNQELAEEAASLPPLARGKRTKKRSVK